MPNIYFLIAILAGMATVGFLMGVDTQFSAYESSFNVTSGSTSGGTVIFNFILAALSNWQNWVALGAFISIGVLLGGNLAAVIPFALASVMVNAFVMPLGYVSMYPDTIVTVINVFFGLAIFMVFMQFIRSG